MLDWHNEFHQAALEDVLPNGVVQCRLSPRNCKIKPGELGFCKVRGNVDGRLVTFNYGRGVQPTEETIETEAVYHFSPGARILSLGNVGCMLNCAYCHNWKTSQAKFVETKDVHDYSPQAVVDMALRHGIPGLSWTYNDPVVWHEFVLETAKLAKDAGLFNLYKSAFFITPEAVDELLPYIDIFSISLKAIDEHYYRRITTGWLQPVLDATKQVYDAGKHVEISNLMVTDLSDDEDSARKMAEFVMDELDDDVPLHFVRFHPDYRMRDTSRTPIFRLQRAREIAIDTGLKYVYLGNVFDAANTHCQSCDALLVERFGLRASRIGLTSKGRCSTCSAKSPISVHFPSRNDSANQGSMIESDYDIRQFDWHGDICSIHIQTANPNGQMGVVHHRRRLRNGRESDWVAVPISSAESYRFIVSKGSDDEIGICVAVPKNFESNLHEVFDRAHFPTIPVEKATAESDQTPLPIFEGTLQMISKSDDEI